jgi:hypothetical protein
MRWRIYKSKNDTRVAFEIAQNRSSKSREKELRDNIELDFFKFLTRKDRMEKAICQYRPLNCKRLNWTDLVIVTGLFDNVKTMYILRSEISQRIKHKNPTLPDI